MLQARLSLALSAAAIAFLGAGSASASYFGTSYVKVPGISGGAKPARYKGWVKTEGYYWRKRPYQREIRGLGGIYSGLKFTGSVAPAKGPDVLTVSINKKSPALKAMMERCRKGERISEITYAESAELARHPQEYGPRPADIPEFYEYALKGVTLSCPVVADAPEQAFAMQFEEIQWLNYLPQSAPIELTEAPAVLPAAPTTGATKTFVISWFANITDASADQCPKMNSKPSQESYYTLMSPARAAEQRAALAKQGGVNTQYLPWRGPDEMNVTLLPGVVADPGHLAPKADIVRGFNLDGDDGSGRAPKNTVQHKNFTAPWGEKGVDNQLFTVAGCIEGFRRNGFLPLISNDQRRAGLLSILVEVSGIDDERNDNDVAVTLFYSNDPMKRDGTSKVILPDYTYSLSSNPEYSADFVRFHGKIVDGVVTTEPLEKAILHEGQASGWPMYKARMRLEFKPDGSMSAVLGGYRDWRQYMAYATFRSSDYENTIGYDTPGLYNAVKRAADGMKDPVTGEFLGISAAYELEGVPAFLPPKQQQALAMGRLAEK